MIKLHHLIYFSQAAKDFSNEQLQELINEARFNNLILQITGLLLHGEGKFVQVLEGCKTNIEETMGKILFDRRHTNVNVVTFEPIQHRAFEQWNMGLTVFSSQPEIQQKLLEQCGHKIQFDSLSHFDAAFLIKSFSKDVFKEYIG